MTIKSGNATDYNKTNNTYNSSYHHRGKSNLGKPTVSDRQFF